jgi:hypothetical protein
MMMSKVYPKESDEQVYSKRLVVQSDLDSYLRRLYCLLMLTQAKLVSHCKVMSRSVGRSVERSKRDMILTVGLEGRENRAPQPGR